MAKKRRRKHSRGKQNDRLFMLVLELMIIVSLILVFAAMTTNIVNKKAEKNKETIQNELVQTKEVNPQKQENAEQSKEDKDTKDESAIKENANGSTLDSNAPEKPQDTAVENENSENNEADDKTGASAETEKNTEEKTEIIQTDGTQSEAEKKENGNNQTAEIQNNASVTQIDLNGLSTESLGWGQGVHFDELNRPVGSLNYQDKYGKYQAYFIGENNPVIYLTFDEGYEYGCSNEILDVLKEKGVKAVFFITQSYAKNNPDLVRRMIDEGHKLGNHSVTHPSQGLPSQTIEQQKEEIMGCHNYIKDNFGYEMNLFRYPAGKFSEQSLAIVNNCNYKSLFWSFAYLDYDVNNQPNEAESLQKLVDRLHPGAIYLLHAESVTNTHILGSLIDKGREMGYSFEVFP